MRRRRLIRVAGYGMVRECPPVGQLTAASGDLATRHLIMPRWAAVATTAAALSEPRARRQSRPGRASSTPVVLRPASKMAGAGVASVPNCPNNSMLMAC